MWWIVGLGRSGVELLGSGYILRLEWEVWMEYEAYYCYGGGKLLVDIAASTGSEIRGAEVLFGSQSSNVLYLQWYGISCSSPQ